MSPTTKPTRPVMSTPLRVFIAISIALHIALVGFIVVPSILGLFRPREEPLSEEQVMLMKQRAAEKVTQEAAREEIKKELMKALKEDLRSVASELSPAKFEQAWTNALSAIQSNLNQTAEQLAKSNLTEITPQDLDAAMRGLRQAEIDALMAQLGDVSKEEIAAQVLSGVAATIPEFNQKTKELMEQTESPKIRGEVDKLLAEERARRQKELTAANANLGQAQQQLEQANNQSAAIGSSLARTLGDNQKRTDAAAKADAAVAQALKSAAEAERQTRALDQALAARLAADAHAAQDDALLKDAAKHQAELEKAVAGAQTALREAAGQAEKARSADARDGLNAAAASVEKTAADPVKAMSAAIQSGVPAKAASAADKAASALAEAAHMADDMANVLAQAATTNAAMTNAVAAARKSVSSATNLLEKAVASARATAEASRRADEQRRAAVADAAAPSRSGIEAAVSAAQNAVQQAARTAAREQARTAGRALQDTAMALTQILASAAADLDRQLGRTNLAAAADQAGKVATELDAAARRLDANAATLAQEARDRKSGALARDASSLSDAARQLRDAEARAQGLASAAKDAATPVGLKRDAYADLSKTGIAEAQDAARTALEGAAKELRNTAAPFTDKAERPVADALAKTARVTDNVVNGPVRRTAELTVGKDLRGALQNEAQTHAAISNLVNELTTARGELAAMTGKPTTDEVNVADAAHKAIDHISKTLDLAEKSLGKAAAAADKGSETIASRAIEETSGLVRETDDAVVGHAADALAPKPADPQIPNSGPRPGRKEISIAQRDMDTTTNRLTALSRQVSDQKSFLGGAGQRFESNFVQTVENTLVEDPALRRQTQAFVRQTLREKVASEFREKTESLVEKVLEKKGMDKDDRFVKRVGQQAADLLLSGSESNLFDSAFAEMMGQTAKEFGVKPDALRKKLSKEEAADEAGDEEVAADDGTGKQDATGDNQGKKKKKHKKPGGPEAAGAEGEGSDEDNNGMDAVGQALAGELGKSLKRGAQSAIGSSAKSSLHLPGADSFGQSASDSLRQSLAGARGNGLRSMSTGGRETSLAGMSDSLAKLGVSLMAGASSGRRTGLFDNPAEYRKNLDEVIKGREVKEVVLVAPSLTNAVSAASSEIASNRPSLILVGSRRDLKQAATNLAIPAERLLVPPDFKSFAYGGAPFTTNPPVIDGDLADWAGVQPFALRGTIKKSYWNKPFPAAWETNRYLMVQWDYTGVYCAYRLVDDNDDIDVDGRNFWEGDCLELWFDFSNRRSDERGEDQQQFWFWPLGSRRMPGSIGGEAIMPGFKMDTRFRADSKSPNDPKMAVKRTTNPKGYTVELYLPLACFKKPDLVPGRVIAFDFSIHNGEGAYLRWTTELGKHESMTPSVWGDLVLLGSDAEILAVKPRQTSEKLAAIIPGEPLGVRLFDPDMNTDPRVRNQVKVKFESSAGRAVIGYLQETDVNTGIFEGSIDTVEVLPGEDRDIANNALPVVCGGYVEVSYYDQARRYGERNYTARKRVPVGVPVMRMAVKR